MAKNKHLATFLRQIEDYKIHVGCRLPPAPIHAIVARIEESESRQDQITKTTSSQHGKHSFAAQFEREHKSGSYVDQVVKSRQSGTAAEKNDRRYTI